MVRVDWSDRATDQLFEIARYLARDSRNAAQTAVHQVLRATDQLAAFPYSGRVVPEFEETGVRELIVGNYRLIYQARGDSVTVLMIQHGARALRWTDLPPLALDEG